MAARFVNKREITSLDQLTPVECEQLQLAGKAYDGKDRPVADRLAGDGTEEVEGSFQGGCVLWEIVDADQPLYDAWLLMSDSGSIYRARTTEEVASIVQCGLECDDPEIRREIGIAMVEAELLPPGDSAYQEFAADANKP
ncbi:MAG: hypothetical protein M3680_21315 [Myxococcota bacterium]|nr:hypothetical protein [Myxococcota bacterium]